MTPDSPTGWTFSENAIRVDKTFEKLVKRYVVIGLAINTIALLLLLLGVIQKPGNQNALRTLPVPAPENWTTQHATAYESAGMQRSGSPQDHMAKN